MPEVIVYETSNIFVYGDVANIVLNTAPNLTGIDEIFIPVLNIPVITVEIEQFFINMV